MDRAQNESRSIENSKLRKYIPDSVTVKTSSSVAEKPRETISERVNAHKIQQNIHIITNKLSL